MAELFNDFYKGKRVLITGHTGFKGSWLSLWLHKLGAEVIGYSLKPPTLPNIFEVCGIGKIVNPIIGDIRDLERLKETFAKYQPQIVFHMAAQSLVRYSYIEPIETYQTNIIGTVNLFEICRHTSSVKVIINVTSDKCYENRRDIRGYKEEDPIGGYDPYSSSKGCAELVTNAYLHSYFNPESYKQHGKSLSSVRAGNCIGGGDWALDRLLPDCVRSLSKNEPIVIRYPDAVRPWQHVLEPLYGYLLLAQRLYQEGPTFVGGWNFGPDDEALKPVKWLVQEITQMWGKGATWAIDKNNTPYESPYLWLDCSKAKSKLVWHPQWNLQLALEKTIQWYKAYYEGGDILDITINQIQSYEESAKKNSKYAMQVLR